MMSWSDMAWMRPKRKRRPQINNQLKKPYLVKEPHLEDQLSEEERRSETNLAEETSQPD